MWRDVSTHLSVSPTLPRDDGPMGGWTGPNTAARWNPYRATPKNGSTALALHSPPASFPFSFIGLGQRNISVAPRRKPPLLLPRARRDRLNFNRPSIPPAPSPFLPPAERRLNFVERTLEHEREDRSLRCIFYRSD